MRKSGPILLIMTLTLFADILGFLGLLPLAVLGRRQADTPDARYWGMVVIAVLLSLLAATSQMEGGNWQAGLATAVWWSVATTLILFAVMSAYVDQLWRLVWPLGLYLIPISLLAVVFGSRVQPAPITDLSPWFWVHVGVSLLTYGLVTLAAIAATGFVLQERALKHRRPTAATRALPALRDCERLLVRLLSSSAAVLTVGMISGFGLRAGAGKAIFTLDHKTLFSIGTLVVIVALLVAHQISGLRGKHAVRLVLSAYLLLTIAYLGVKFVTGMLLP